jgi:hypothetical protein
MHPIIMTNPWFMAAIIAHTAVAGMTAIETTKQGKERDDAIADAMRGVRAAWGMDYWHPLKEEEPQNEGGH